MKELLRSNNPVLISRLCALLKGAGVEFFIADFNASILEGSVSALPQRLLVFEDDTNKAEKLIRGEGLGDCLADSKQAPGS